jgi:hypothetical protein
VRTTWLNRRIDSALGQSSSLDRRRKSVDGFIPIVGRSADRIVCELPSGKAAPQSPSTRAEVDERDVADAQLTQSRTIAGVRRHDTVANSY